MIAWYICSMATVILPMGYPIQQGTEFDMIVFQGNLVRRYTLPKDPRNDSQVFERRFLSDVTRMRSTMGLWGKEVCKAALGSKWATILYQIIKADVGNWWSDAVTEWEGFEDENRDAWRDVAPYKLAFNDLGKIFFCLTRVIYYAVSFYGKYAFDVVEWGEEDSAAALVWWEKNLLGAWGPGKVETGHTMFFESVGTWESIYNVGASNNWYVRANGSGAIGRLYVLGRRVLVCYVKAPGWGSLKISLDGDVVTTISLANAVEVFGLVYEVPLDWSTEVRRLRMLEFEAVGGMVGVDFIMV